jgi:hypothetical protein
MYMDSIQLQDIQLKGIHDAHMALLSRSSRG